LRRTLLASTAWLVLAGPVAACDALETRESPLEIRRPVRGEDVRLTAGFGMRMHPILGYPRMHTGVDWAAPHGTPVIAAGRGRVISAEVDGAYGNRVLIDHGGPWQTLYSQLASFSVRKGDCVEAGMVIGAVGATGLAAGPHLHFEVRRNGAPIDPMILPLKPPTNGVRGRP